MNNVEYKIGLTGNAYVFSKNKDSVVEICLKIGKSIKSVYFNKKYKLYAIRVKDKKTKTMLKSLF